MYEFTLIGFEKEKYILKQIWGHNMTVQKCACECAVWLESANLRNVILSTFHCNSQESGLGPIQNFKIRQTWIFC